MNIHLKGPLTSPKIEYVFFHWGQHVNLHPSIRSCICTGTDSTRETGKIIFPLSDKPVTVTEERDGVLPVLFPVGDAREFYHIDGNGNLVFTHDVIQSVYYLLAGVQEIDHPAKDSLGRFPYEESIQCKGNFIHKPLVNYYFEKMTEGLERFCELHHLAFERKRLFPTFGFFLSHDIDKVDRYTFNEVGYEIKELVGWVSSKESFSTRLRKTTHSLVKWSGVTGRDNPHWNFDFLLEVEKLHNFVSTFFFLDKGVLHADAYHSFSEKRMKDLFASIKKGGCEIAMHGTVRSLNNKQVMADNKRNLEKESGIQVIGNRQHRLLWHHPETARIEEELGIQYDASLGFAAHEGFRNSYCYPFRLYDVQKDRMLDVWELPLQVMDVSLFAYRGLSLSEAHAASQRVLEEVKKFGGVFSLLWHNSFLDEAACPGITGFYKDLLASIASQKPESVTGKQVLDRLK